MRASSSGGAGYLGQAVDLVLVDPANLAVVFVDEAGVGGHSVLLHVPFEVAVTAQLYDSAQQTQPPPGVRRGRAR